ncbi:hypothetical protein [Saccharothrix variisporea]|uniref:Lipoprotein LprG n=1 Tax=Saccharothrix variisporea TaxID=543527 RepID=A0A495XG09_9PSEU|nr:hypothetical protein [Saccharothrix variisporea]RKT72947.1 hypothetical protein DFJ66_6273 [Saccharothrix variisporea]
MRRLLLVLVPFVLVACTTGTDPAPPTASSPPKGDLAVLAEKIDQRRAELKTARFHTEGFASDGASTEVRSVVDGTVRQEPEGITGTMAMTMTTAGQTRKMDLVIAREGLYVHVDGAPMPEGKKWGLYTSGNSSEVTALLRGFGPGATVGAELDYVQPRAALIVSKTSEPVDGVAATRYDLVVDPLKMAKVIKDADIQLQHTQLAEHGVAINAVVWVDDAGTPVKAEYRFELDGKVVKQSTTRFTEWGGKFDVPLPPAAEVIPADQLPR